MSWRTKMEEQRQLRSQGAEVLYDRMKLLREIENDDAFGSWCDDHGKLPIDELDNELGDVGYGFNDLTTVMEHYPEKSDWSKKLTSLIAAVMEAERAKRKEARGESGTRTSWKEIAEERQLQIDALERECEKLRGAIEELRGLTKAQLASA